MLCLLHANSTFSAKPNLQGHQARSESRQQRQQAHPGMRVCSRKPYCLNRSTNACRAYVAQLSSTSHNSNAPHREWAQRRRTALRCRRGADWSAARAPQREDSPWQRNCRHRTAISTESASNCSQFERKGWRSGDYALESRAHLRISNTSVTQ